MTGIRWPSAALLQDWDPLPQGSVCAVMWPTRSLADKKRWFDDLYVWTEGFEAGTMHRAHIQYRMLGQALHMLEAEHVERAAITLSFGTVERLLDPVTALFEKHPFVIHRMVVLLRGDVERLRSPYRFQGFVDWLRAHNIPVGYRITAPRISMEMGAIDLFRPDFIKVAAPPSRRVEYWQDMAVEARMSGLDAQRVIVAGIEDAAQRRMATESGFGFGQGNALKPPYDPSFDVQFPLPSVQPSPMQTHASPIVAADTLGSTQALDMPTGTGRPPLNLPFPL